MAASLKQLPQLAHSSPLRRRALATPPPHLARAVAPRVGPEMDSIASWVLDKGQAVALSYVARSLCISTSEACA